MKFIVDTKVIIDALGEVVKSPLRGMGNRSKLIQIDAKDGQVIFTANMMSSGIPAEIEEPGSCLLKYSKLLPLLKTFSQKGRIYIEANETGIKIDKVFIPANIWSISLTDLPASLESEDESNNTNQLKLGLDQSG